MADEDSAVDLDVDSVVVTLEVAMDDDSKFHCSFVHCSIQLTRVMIGG